MKKLFTIRVTQRTSVAGFFLILFFILISCKKDNVSGEADRFSLPREVSEVILRDYHIISIAFDPAGTAWLGTLRQGLLKYERNQVTVFDSSNSVLTNAAIWDIEVDKKGNVWLGTDALVKVKNSEFTRYEAGQFNLPKNPVFSVEIDSADNIWFTCASFRSGGLVKYDGSRFTIFTPENSQLPAHLISSLAMDKSDNLWLTVNESVSSATLARLSGNRWHLYGPEKIGFSPYYYGNVVVDSQGDIVASLDYGLSSTFVPQRPQAFRFNGQKAEILKLPNENSVVYATKQVFFDKEDRLWVSFYGGEKEYAVFSNKKWTFHDLPGEGVFAFGEKPTGEMWLGTGKGVCILK
ncbi:ligand-binding sensor domain-containing protein [Dyadobacter helix]|nr:two-component regulator propeller domain-containing protein [Dyadobacter sp. CECT 9275]